MCLRIVGSWGFFNEGHTTKENVYEGNYGNADVHRLLMSVAEFFELPPYYVEFQRITRAIGDTPAIVTGLKKVPS